jgi:N-acetylmuramoyl-L-alanine amidase
MSFVTRRNTLILTAIAVAGGVAIPLGHGFTFETVEAAEPASPVFAVADPATIESMIADEGQQILSTFDSSEIAVGPDIPAPERALVDPELECIAKVVHHEAANQPRDGQLAVAQLIMNRVESGRFPDTPCKVANQPGQFFNTHAYRPRKDSRWDMAVDVAREARDGATADVVPGAYFYHAAYQAPNRFFQSRQRVAVLGDHVFYR